MARMDHLPTELVENICNFCQFQDLKNLRLTSKTFVEVTSPRIFSDFYLGFFLTHLQRLLSLSSAPHLARHVKRFYFVGDVLPEFESWVEWEEVIDLRQPWSSFRDSYFKRHNVPITESPELMLENAVMETMYGGEDIRTRALREYDDLPKHTLLAEDLTRHYEKYLEYREQQLQWSEREDDLFVQAFSSLLNLVAVRNERYGFAGSNMAPPWRTLRREILIGPDNWMVKHMTEADDLDEEDGEQHHSANELEKPIHMRHATCLLKGLIHRAQNLADGGSHVKELVLANVGSQPFIYNTGPPAGHRDTQTQRAIVPPMYGFEHLVSLNLSVNHQLWTTGPHFLIWRGNQLATELRAMLQAATNLQQLQLTLVDEDEDWDLDNEDELVNGHDLFGRLTPLVFPQLKTLYLSANTIEQKLKRFLKTNAGSLKELSLVDCHIFPEGGWESLIGSMPDYLRLDDVYFEGLGDSTSDDAPETYFVTGLDVGVEADAYDKAIKEWVLSGGTERERGEMPSLEYGEFYYQRGLKMPDN